MLYLQLLDTSLMGGALARRHGGEQRWLPCMQRTVVNMAEIESEPVTMAEGSTSEEEESDHSSSYLSLHCSSSPFEGDGSASGADPGFPNRGFYLFKYARKFRSHAHFVETTPIFVCIRQ